MTASHPATRVDTVSVLQTCARDLQRLSQRGTTYVAQDTPRCQKENCARELLDEIDEQTHAIERLIQAAKSVS